MLANSDLLFLCPMQVISHHELFYSALTSRTMEWTTTQRVGDIFMSTVRTGGEGRREDWREGGRGGREGRRGGREGVDRHD